jgi:hypothetical protein
MLKLRLVHFYLGPFFAPLILFFALSGVLQVFKLHEAYRDVPGSRGDWIAWFGQFRRGFLIALAAGIGLPLLLMAA